MNSLQSAKLLGGCENAITPTYEEKPVWGIWLLLEWLQPSFSRAGIEAELKCEIGSLKPEFPTYFNEAGGVTPI
jgi:hypothetical protein